MYFPPESEDIRLQTFINTKFDENQTTFLQNETYVFEIKKFKQHGKTLFKILFFSTISIIKMIKSKIITRSGQFQKPGGLNKLL